MLEQAGGGFAAATELAAMIHRRTGLSARTAHRVVGNLVLRASKRGLSGRDVDLALVDESAREVLGHGLDGVDEEAVRTAMDPRGFIEAHDVPGGPAPVRVREAIAASRERLEAHGRTPVREARERRAAARRELDELCTQRRKAVVR
jgi:argininosuccinate lyase